MRSDPLWSLVYALIGVEYAIDLHGELAAKLSKTAKAVKVSAKVK